MNEKERRRHERVELGRPGMIQIGRGPEMSTYFTEISEGGVRCLFSEITSLGVTAELRFMLPLVVEKECVLSGRVQHYHKEGDSYVLGVEFSRVATDVMEAIRAFVQMQERAK